MTQTLGAVLITVIPSTAVILAAIHALRLERNHRKDTTTHVR